jgi:formylglycine-generating enzyme required for sulfatase activity
MNRIVHGCFWGSNPRYTRVATRCAFAPDYRYYSLGLRLAGSER